MKKGITFYFGFSGNPELRAKAIAEAGFNNVSVGFDPKFKKQNGSIKTQLSLFKKYGLGLTSLHFRYNQKDLPEYWKDSKIGKTMQKSLIKDLKIAKKYNFKCVVVHLDGESSAIGFERLDRVLKLCEKWNVPLAIENIDNNARFFEVMEHYKNNSFVRFCYDIGHHNLFDKDFDFLKHFKDKLICFHLHDNMGQNNNQPAKNGKICFDEHTLNKYGSIDWNKVAKKFAKLTTIPSLDYEMLYKIDHGENMEDVLNITMNQAKELEQKINLFKNKK